MVQQWGAQPTVTVLTGQGSTQACRERADVGERTVYPRAPVTACHVDERIDVRVRITRVPKNHPRHVEAPERCTDTAHILPKTVRRYTAILDELHGP